MKYAPSRSGSRIGYDPWISWECADGTPSRDDPALVGRVMPYLGDLWERA